jgi:hypothetical protein
MSTTQKVFRRVVTASLLLAGCAAYTGPRTDQCTTTESFEREAKEYFSLVQYSSYMKTCAETYPDPIFHDELNTTNLALQTISERGSPYKYLHEIFLKHHHNRCPDTNTTHLAFKYQHYISVLNTIQTLHQDVQTQIESAKASGVLHDLCTSNVKTFSGRY